MLNTFYKVVVPSSKLLLVSLFKHIYFSLSFFFFCCRSSTPRQVSWTVTSSPSPALSSPSGTTFNTAGQPEYFLTNLGDDLSKKGRKIHSFIWNCNQILLKVLKEIWKMKHVLKFTFPWIFYISFCQVFWPSVLQPLAKNHAKDFSDLEFLAWGGFPLLSCLLEALSCFSKSKIHPSFSWFHFLFTIDSPCLILTDFLDVYYNIFHSKDQFYKQKMFSFWKRYFKIFMFIVTLIKNLWSWKIFEITLFENLQKQ